MKKALVSISLVTFVSAIVWAAPGDRGAVIPGRDDPDPELEAAGQFKAQRVDFPRQIRVQVEFIEMPHELLTELLYQSRPGSADAGTLREVVQARVKKGDATILETMICTARSGEKGMTESISEYIYPTEYEKGTVPNSVTVSVGGTSSTAVTEEGKTASALELGKLIAPPTPSSFETRNLGSTLEIEPTLGAGNDIIDLRFAPDLVWHTGDTYFREEKDSLGNVTKIQMPVMYTIRTTTAVTMRDGQYQMPCVLTPKDVKGSGDPSRKVMLFVKCDVVTVK
jgi:hypothetical protein